MKITQFTDFSLRLLLLLARDPGRIRTVREVAEYYDISSEHLKKIVRRLSELGYIQTVRGKNGGLKLAVPAASINVGKLFREQENLAILPCWEPGCTCPCEGCKLRDLADAALAAFLAEFDGKTLADLI